MAVPCEMLLHPELLTNEQLIQIIQERHLCIQNLHRLVRNELLDLFHKFCVPYGQRKYRDSGRGRVLNKIRHLSPEPIKINTFNDSSGNRKKFLHASCDRITPPPDLLSCHMKKIKLDNLSPSFIINVNKRKMSIDSISPVADSPPPKKERNLITWP